MKASSCVDTICEMYTCKGAGELVHSCDEDKVPGAVPPKSTGGDNLYKICYTFYILYCQERYRL